ncbi:TBC [Nesidiocoris tenuis]|uniref:TBC n=2 Tax=Nesidiocoris tenuis TaxID=355587 RepID=A0ABN7AJG9_9HEMI|nr:TBC [Nesidiocoris tenuis]
MDLLVMDHDDSKSASFWKKNNKALPGRPSPRKELKVISYNPAAPSTSFQDFQQSINDAWDPGDDEFCSISSVKISKKSLQNVSNDVINIHKYKCNDIKNLNSQNQRKEVCRIGDISADKDNDVLKKKIKKFQAILCHEDLDLNELQNLSWPGIPFPVKADVWRILSGYAPTNSKTREKTLNEKRKEYWAYVKELYETENRDDSYQGTYRQIHIDVPRMSPNIPLFRQTTVQKMFERILFIWSVRHPASGYVQGINDLVTPFFIVFVHQALGTEFDLGTFDIETLDSAKRDQIEADSHWCFVRFLSGIQDNYIFPQLGIQHKISDLRDIIKRIEEPLHKHLQDNGVEYLQFSFRWMNNLLTRELPLRCLIRLWDTYLAELDSFASFQLYVCAAFLLHWKQELLLEKDFQGLMLMLQNLPTQDWNDSDINLLVAEAYRLKCSFAGAPNHFQSKTS